MGVGGVVVGGWGGGSSSIGISAEVDTVMVVCVGGLGGDTVVGGADGGGRGS